MASVPSFDLPISRPAAGHSLLENSSLEAAHLVRTRSALQSEERQRERPKRKPCYRTSCYLFGEAEGQQSIMPFTPDLRRAEH